MIRAVCSALLPIVTVATVWMTSSDAAAIAWQRNGGQHHVFAEGGGNALLASLNYEFRYAGAATFRIGFLPAFGSGEDAQHLAVPVSVGILAGTVAHMADIAIGATYMPDAPEPLLLMANVGYRFIAEGGFVLRVFANPVLELNKQGAFIWGGASVGYCFQ